MSFKDKLKEKRLEANLTQVQLAEKVSVTIRGRESYLFQEGTKWFVEAKEGAR